MFSFLQPLFESYQIGSHRHAMLVHLPIVLSMVALVLLVMLVITRGKRALWRRLTLIVLLTGLLFSRLAAEAGTMALNDLSLPLTMDAMELLEAHEIAGQRLWWFFLITALLVLPTFINRWWVRLPASIIALVAGVILLLQVALIAHQGGSLVYDHGVGVPATDNNVPPRTPVAD